MRLCRAIGKGEVPDSDESADGLEALNAMMDAWAGQVVAALRRTEERARTRADLLEWFARFSQRWYERRSDAAARLPEAGRDPFGKAGWSLRMAKKDEEKREGETAAPETADSPLLDLSDAAVKRMIKLAKKRGYVTHDELNAVLPSEEVSSDQIEDVYAMLNEMGITVSEAEEDAEGEEAADEQPDQQLIRRSLARFVLLLRRPQALQRPSGKRSRPTWIWPFVSPRAFLFATCLKCATK